MNANAHSARNGPRRLFATAIAIAGFVVAGFANAPAPLVNEQVAIPKAGLLEKNSGQKIQAAQNNSPGTAHAVSANQLISQFDVANHAFGGVINSPNELAKLASDNNGVNAVTSNIAPLDTSPPPAAVGRFLVAVFGHAQVESEGGVCSGAILASTGTYTDPVGVVSKPAALAYAA